MAEILKVGGKFKFYCYGPDGELKWKDTAKNRVVTEGVDHVLDILLKNGTVLDPWYIGLTDGAPTVDAGDTLGSHVGWTEVTAYTGDRQEFVDGAIAAGTVNNSASKASFAISADGTTIGGGFLASVATGTTGTLLCAAAFDGGNKNADNGDTLEVQYDFSAADDGV